MTARLRLRRSDGSVYLQRWGIDRQSWGVYLHKMDAPDPGRDVHSHPFTFYSLILKGGYVEERIDVRAASAAARIYPDGPRGYEVQRRRWTIKKLGLDEAHRITRLYRSPTWTLVFRGARKQEWGFYTPSGWVNDSDYTEHNTLLRVERP